MRSRTTFLKHMALLCVGILVSVILCRSASAATQTGGFVYVATNETTGNAVIQFLRFPNGVLIRVGQVSTGGLGGAGNGVGALDPLGSQDSLVLNGTGSLLLAVNAGSNTVSSLQAGAAGVKLMSTVSSGGSFPNSVALHDDLVYVLNALTQNISGFRVSSTGVLQPITGSARNLPGGATAAPHDIRFSPDGTRLLVSEDVTNQIDVFQLGSDGTATSVTTTPSAGSGPFGMRFARGGFLLNTEANTASASSYELGAQGALNVISPAVANGQAATCWISVTGDGKFGFTSNTGSGTLSAYQVSANGTLNLENAVAGSLNNGGAPIDSARTSDSAFLYVVDSALGRIVSFKVNGASLKPLGAVTGLPTSLQGIAAQ